MALVLGTNCGFCLSAPSEDPSGTAGSTLANLCIVQKHVLDAGDYIITEIGFWQDATNNSQCNFNVGIYNDDGGGASSKPSSLFVSQSSGLYVAANTAGWAKYPSLSIEISGGTYWIAVGSQNVVTDIKTNYGTISGSRTGSDTISGPTISDPWSATGESFASSYAYAIYAVYEAASSGLSIPVVQAHYRRRR